MFFLSFCMVFLFTSKKKGNVLFACKRKWIDWKWKCVIIIIHPNFSPSAQRQILHWYSTDVWIISLHANFRKVLLSFVLLHTKRPWAIDRPEKKKIFKTFSLRFFFLLPPLSDIHHSISQLLILAIVSFCSNIFWYTWWGWSTQCRRNTTSIRRRMKFHT